MWAELPQLHLTPKWSSSLVTLCIIGWILHVCHCVTKTDRGAKVRGDCVLMFLSFFFPPCFYIYESRIMTTAPKHNHQPHLPPCPIQTSVKEKKNHVSFFKHSNKKNNSCSGYKHVPRPQNLMTVHLPSCVLTQQITVSSYTTQLQHYLLSGDFNVVSL